MTEEFAPIRLRSEQALRECPTLGICGGGGLEEGGRRSLPQRTKCCSPGTLCATKYHSSRDEAA